MNQPRFISPFRLRDYGILGINRRNRDYVSRYNPRRLFPLVDNKLLTKQTVAMADIPTPNLICEIRQQSEIRHLLDHLDGHNGFAVKPAKGSGGKGILVITHREGDVFYKSSGAAVSAEDLQRHVSNILSGLYSLGGSADVTLIEDLIHVAPHFERFTVEGVPDIRVIVCRGFPVMAMMRLSTHASDGKANLHQGAVGVGLDLASGKALNAVQRDQTIDVHPDTGEDLSALVVPDWNDLLVTAARCYDVTGLGYLGTDMVIDRDRGPLLLELNARPGLSIQMTNGAGLLPRLKKIDGLKEAETRFPAEKRVAMSQSWFGGIV